MIFLQSTNNYQTSVSISHIYSTLQIIKASSNFIIIIIIICFKVQMYSLMWLHPITSEKIFRRNKIRSTQTKSKKTHR